MTWTVNKFESDTPDGTPMAVLHYGIPETDAVAFQATCGGPDGPVPQAVFWYDITELDEGDQVSLAVVSDGFEDELPGKVYGKELEVGVSGIQVGLDADAPVWTAMANGPQLTYGLAGGKQEKLHLDGAAEAVSKFVSECKAMTSTAPQDQSATAEPKDSQDEQTTSSENTMAPAESMGAGADSEDNAARVANDDASAAAAMDAMAAAAMESDATAADQDAADAMASDAMDSAASGAGGAGADDMPDPKMPAGGSPDSEGEYEALWSTAGENEEIVAIDCSDDCEEDIGIIIACKGSGKPAEVTVNAAASQTGEDGAEAPFTIVIGEDSFTRNARTLEFGMIGFTPKFSMPQDDPILEALQSGQHHASVEFNGEVSDINLEGAREALDSFKTNCGWTTGVSPEQQ